MAPAILSYFGFGSSTPAVEETPIRELPSSWYTSRDTYDLERRAIFSRRWLFITHQNRLNLTGEWLRYSVAGFAFILCRDRDGKINGFHNVCRHRAYPVVEGADSGVAKILACRYHGWSYGLNGKLAKAPGYQELEGFDKSKNGLFPIHVHIDDNGFIWVNFDVKEKPEIAWEEDFEAVEKQQQFSDVDFEQYQFDHAWEQKGEFNWKLLADNFNQTYHSSASQEDEEDESSLVQPTSPTVEVQGIDIETPHVTATTEEQKAAIPDTYYFPNASMNVTPSFLFIQRFEPSSPTTTTLKYEIYRSKSGDEATFQKINSAHKQLMTDSKIRCEAKQRSIETAPTQISVENNSNNTDSNEESETPLYFQEIFRDEVDGHHKREQKAKREIWPARQELPTDNKGAGISKEDIEFCEGLACGDGANVSKIAW